MKDCLLVTLADNNYIEAAKQLFAGAYLNGGWQGEYLLLAHKVDPLELQWFQMRGIRTHPCDTDHINIARPLRPKVLFAKFTLLTSFFKKWRVVVFLDADILVRGSLAPLARVAGFAAVKDSSNLGMQFVETFNIYDYSVIQDRIDRIRRQFVPYDLDLTGFNSGVMAFNTRLINEETTARLEQLLKLYAEYTFTGDQGILNLLFYRHWQRLPSVYNLYFEAILSHTGICSAAIRGVVFHFILGKPWNSSSSFYTEWKSNLDRAAAIDFNLASRSVRSWSRCETSGYGLYLRLRKMWKKLSAANP